MYVDICKYKRGNKTYKRVLLREGYREGGKVKHRTLANLSHCSDEEIEAIRIALKMKKQIVYGLLTDITKSQIKTLLIKGVFKA